MRLRKESTRHTSLCASLTRGPKIRSLHEWMKRQTQEQKLETWNRNRLTRKYYSLLQEAINYLKCQLPLRKVKEASKGISHVSEYLKLPPPHTSQNKTVPWIQEHGCKELGKLDCIQKRRERLGEGGQKAQTSSYIYINIICLLYRIICTSPREVMRHRVTS